MDVGDLIANLIFADREYVGTYRVCTCISKVFLVAFSIHNLQFQVVILPFQMVKAFGEADELWSFLVCNERGGDDHSVILR